MTTPAVPAADIGWLLGIIGGVGGTVTLLSYGYWVQEMRRSGPAGSRLCRIDLGAGYTMTALFGMAMMIIGSQVSVDGKGATVSLLLAQQLETAAGPAGKWCFLIGFWGAVFTSLLGVWQSVPYLFADFLYLRRNRSDPAQADVQLTETKAYRYYMIGIGSIPMVLLWMTVTQIQLLYAVLGALFMPLLAWTLLMMNNKTRWVGKQLKNGWLINTILIATLIFFSFVGVRQIIQNIY